MNEVKVIIMESPNKFSGQLVFEELLRSTSSIDNSYRSACYAVLSKARYHKAVTQEKEDIKNYQLLSDL